MMLLVDSLCLLSFRFGITHVVGIPGCVLSSLNGWHMELVFTVDGLAM